MRFVEHSFNDCAKAEAFSARNIKMIGKLRGDCISVMQSPSPISAVTKRCFFRRGTKMDLISISFLSLLLMLPDRGEAHVIPVTANALVIMLQIFQSYWSCAKKIRQSGHFHQASLLKRPSRRGLKQRTTTLTHWLKNVAFRQMK